MDNEQQAAAAAAGVDTAVDSTTNGEVNTGGQAAPGAAKQNVHPLEKAKNVHPLGNFSTASKDNVHPLGE